MDRGDIYDVNLDPASGAEQQGRRPVLVVSRAAFNKLGIAVVCPITGGGGRARTAGFAVSLSGCGSDTQGVVLCHQIRAVDLKARGAKRKETVPDFIVNEVVAKLQAIID